MPNSIFEMGGHSLCLDQSFRARIQVCWCDRRAVLEVIVDEVYEQTTYEGLGGEHCSRLDRKRFGQEVARVAEIYGEAKTSQEFFQLLENAKLLSPLER